MARKGAEERPRAAAALEYEIVHAHGLHEMGRLQSGRSGAQNDVVEGLVVHGVEVRWRGCGFETRQAACRRLGRLMSSRDEPTDPALSACADRCREACSRVRQCRPGSRYAASPVRSEDDDAIGDSVLVAAVATRTEIRVCAYFCWCVASLHGKG